MSGISLLYAVTRRLQGNCISSSWRNDIILARYCLEILEFCATADRVAEKFHEVLKNAFDEIGVFTQHDDSLMLNPEQIFPVGYVDPSLESIYKPLEEGSTLYDTSCYLLDIIRQPFAKFAQRSLSETMTSIKESSAYIDWCFEVSSPFNGKRTRADFGEDTSYKLGAVTTRYLQNSWYLITSDPYGWSNTQTADLS